jgi:hypothetical protein
MEGAEVDLSPVEDLEKLIEATSGFFGLHWSPEQLGEPPGWRLWETFLEGSVPGYQYGGCYALFEGNRLTYIGLGVSRGGGLYQQHGLSRRIMAHVYRSDHARGPNCLRLHEKWLRTTGLYTLAFPEHEYLAPALESYLIRDLQPPRNARV